MKLLSTVILLLAAVIGHSQEFVKPNENIVFSFETEKGKKAVVAVDKEEKYIVYRYGTDNNIELEYPSDLTKSWEKFEYSSYHRGGGPENAGLDLDFFAFTNGAYKYVLFSTYSAEEDEKKIGIQVIQAKKEETVVFDGVLSTQEGSLYNLRDFESIVITDEMY